MIRDTAAAELGEAAQPLAWEDLGSRPAGAAFRQSMAELLAHPARFFRRMATTGGLHEPLAFFAFTFTAALLVAFPAALSYFGVAAPDPERTAQQVYSLYVVPARITGLLVALLPLAVVAACTLMVLLGGLFHAAARPFGARNWEGSVSAWLYAGSAALSPSVLSLAAVLIVALGGYLIGLLWPGAKDTAAAFARWTLLVLGSAGLLAGLILLVMDAMVGCTQAFRLDAMLGAAAGVSGLLLVGVAVGLSTWSFASWGLAGGLIVTGAWLLTATAVAVACRAAAVRTEGKA
ncbi:MAG: hypothetical protein AMK73_00350 [Planctomycetes bacterium SM23_32]|nr:MAG: hypothetical protein AMK73_00350 [Planctomycetes bacterium SM23_32]